LVHALRVLLLRIGNVLFKSERRSGRVAWFLPVLVIVKAALGVLALLGVTSRNGI